MSSLRGPGAAERAQQVAKILQRERIYGAKAAAIKTEADVKKAARGAKFNGGEELG